MASTEVYALKSKDIYLPHLRWMVWALLRKFVILSKKFFLSINFLDFYRCLQ